MLESGPFAKHALIADLALDRIPSMTSNTEKTRQELLQALTDPKRSVRESAARALGEQGDSSGIEILIGAGCDPTRKPKARMKPILLLGELGDPRALAPLRALAEDESQWEVLRKLSRKAIEKIDAASPAPAPPEKPQDVPTKRVLRSYSQEGTRNDPSLADVEALVTGTSEWEAIELAAEDDQGVMAAQLILIVEPEHGVLARYGWGKFEDELIFVGDSVQEDEEEIETYDGGDEWIVPAHWFSPWEKVVPLVEAFLAAGEFDTGNGWAVLGVDG